MSIMLSDSLFLSNSYLITNSLLVCSSSGTSQPLVLSLGLKDHSAVLSEYTHAPTYTHTQCVCVYTHTFFIYIYTHTHFFDNVMVKFIICLFDNRIVKFITPWDYAGDTERHCFCCHWESPLVAKCCCIFSCRCLLDPWTTSL